MVTVMGIEQGKVVVVVVMTHLELMHDEGGMERDM